MSRRLRLTNATPISWVTLVVFALLPAGCVSEPGLPAPEISTTGAVAEAPGDVSPDPHAGFGVQPPFSSEPGSDTQARPARSPLAILSAAARSSSGVGSFRAFQTEFLDAVAAGRLHDYVDDIQFPLQVTRIGTAYDDASSSDRKLVRINERLSVSRAEFSPILVHDPDAWTQSVHDLGAAFSGPNTMALYRANRMLTFAIVEGGWKLTEVGLCAHCGSPAHLLCARPGRQAEFPAPGPHGREDFHAFFEVFYCAGHAIGNSDHIPHLTNARTNPDGALTRVRFPLRTRFTIEYSDPPEVTETEIQEEQFRLRQLYSMDGGEGAPHISVDGEEARVEVYPLASTGGGTSVYTRIDGLWYLTRLTD